MAKKITIEGENLQGFSFESDWGGTNDSGAAETHYGTTVPDGKEWGMNHGEVERVVKAKVATMETNIGLKANASDVTEALATKANTSEVTAALATKANASNVETALGLKANASDVTAALALKADRSEIADLAESGGDAVVNVNHLCGAPDGAEYYTLQTAIAAIPEAYRKEGLVITWRTGEREWATKRFAGLLADFETAGLWEDFGGGGSSQTIETSDMPEEGGSDAFSTGGAYNCIPTGINVDTETEGVVKLQLVNEGGEAVGDEAQFNVGTGGGGSGASGTVLSMAFQNSPLYGSAGGTFMLRAAVRSVTTVGGSQQDNTIANIKLYDRDTGALLETFAFNRASSASMQTYDFEMDVTKYFATAGMRRFRCVATDDSENTGNRNVNVTAVDVTISSAQTLRYTQATSLSVGGGARSISLFRFDNNASASGITAITEILLGGSWQELGRTLVQDTYAHSVTINPQSCLGAALQHGVYQLRVHGVDVASGVVGNYLYTGIFVIDSQSTLPLVVESWTSETVNATVKLYESITLNYAVYDPATNAPTATVYIDGVAVQSHTAYRTAPAYTYTHQVSGVASDGTFSHVVKVGTGTAYGAEATFLVSGTVIDAALKDGAIYAFDFANRSNEETDHNIESNGYEISVDGSNWSTTGFREFLGQRCLLVAEDMTAVLNHKPFGPASIESNGMAIQFAFASKNLVDDDAVLMECYDEGTGAGFYVTGKSVAIYCAGGQTNHVEERSYRQGTWVTAAIVVEPAREGLGQTRSGTTYHFMKLYLDGEEVAAIGYVAGSSNLLQERDISFSGTQGNFYLRYIMAWDDYFQFDQAFKNYLVKLTDTEDMVEEFAFEDVMASQQVTELGITTTKIRPQATELAGRGMAYIIESGYNGQGIEDLDETDSTKDQIYVVLRFIDPARPWACFVAYDVARRNQGTTSAQRPVKNPRYYLAQKKGSTYDKVTKTGGTRIELLYTREEIVAMGYDGALWDKAAALAAINKVQIHEDSIPVDIITVKVDFSDSSNANDCGVCDMMNATFRALGNDYMTPAQRAFDGTWKKGDVQLEGLVMNHSTANIPVAMFRSKSETGSNPYFHAKGNWKEDKKEQTALGFIDTPGYNKGCLNYGDFVEFYGGESIAQVKQRFLAMNGLDTSKLYLLTQYGGSSFMVMKYQGNSWVEQEFGFLHGTSGETLADIKARLISGGSADTSKVYILSHFGGTGYNIVEYAGNTWTDASFETVAGSMETLEETKTRFLGTSGLDTTKTYVLTQYCGSSYKVMKHEGGAWVEQSGSMTQGSNGKWTVTGSVVNPVDGFELLNYQGMDWFKGVSSVADMMAPGTAQSKWVKALVDGGSISAGTFPAWTYYYESLVDDDDLAIAYALGKKVPYNLYRWLEFCNRCDYDTYGGDSRLTLWRTDLWKYASPHSCLSYDVFTDYLAAVDQRAKNMQPMWFLEDGCSVVDGVYYNANGHASDSATDGMACRMYLNKVYDCDTCNGKDNDGGQTVDPEVDPNKMPVGGYTNPYAGYSSVLFRNIYLQQTVYVDGSGTELSLKTVAAAMRECQATVDGITLKPFSPEGATHFFLTMRIRRWQKKVSSYDGERKYIDFTSTTANTLYFYALQGLGLTSLPAFIERRWRIRDGFYGTGGFFSGVLTGRVNAPSGAKIRITAAKTGYFGIGNDSSGSLSESVYLEAGQSHDFTDFSHEVGAELYIYQADRMSMIDLSEITLSSTFNFSVMTLAEEIYLGKAGKVNLPLNYTPLTTVGFGDLPFLRVLDIRGTLITNIDCSSCPRLVSLYAADSQLTRADIADGARVTYMQLPATYQYLRLRYLTSLTSAGLVMANPAGISTLIVERCANIDGMELFRTLAQTGGTRLRVVRVTPVSTGSYDGSELTAWTSLGLSGLDDMLEAQQKPALVGTYTLGRYADDDVYDGWQREFPDLDIRQPEYTMIDFDDSVQDDANVTNHDNRTGHDYPGTEYEPSGHIKKLLSQRHRVLAKLTRFPTQETVTHAGVTATVNKPDGEMTYYPLHDSDSRYYADAENVGECSPADLTGGEGDWMMLEPHRWTKGVNDYRGVGAGDGKPRHYSCYSVREERPSTPDVTVLTLEQIQAAGNYRNGYCIQTGGETLSGSYQTNSSYAACLVDVTGFRRVRFPGVLGNNMMGAVFADADGNIVDNIMVATLNARFENGMYLIADVPSGAVTLAFTILKPAALDRFVLDANKVVLDAKAERIEDMEPEWVETEAYLCAVVGSSAVGADNDAKLRACIAGGSTSGSIDWETFHGYSQRRGMQQIDGMMHSDIGNLFFAKYGRRDSQMQCGAGQHSNSRTTGLTAMLGMQDTVNTNGVTVGGIESDGLAFYKTDDGFGGVTYTRINSTNCLGYENIYGHKYDMMDGVDMPNSSGNVYKWRFRMPDGTYRFVKGAPGSMWITAVAHGLYMDLVPVGTLAGSSSTYYSDYYYTTSSTGRVVYRGSYHAYAHGGVSYAYANSAPSYSSSVIGSRLAFRGRVVRAQSVRAYQAIPEVA